MRPFDFRRVNVVPVILFWIVAGLLLLYHWPLILVWVVGFTFGAIYNYCDIREQMNRGT